ncbi:hypothetical protein F5Y13DRAFT_190153 [Hypoxylon sp. FL1857]|nr:hypothetical protein F5Y13DRAFT_190153 [Hypoxylon sp. FL1857]
MSSPQQSSSQQQSSQTRVIHQHDVSLFGDIVKYFDTGLDTNGDHIILDLSCTICDENRLEVPAAVSPQTQPEDSVGLEPMSILPCGHFFGARCLDSWIEACKGQGHVPNCPTCRLELEYRDCGHPIQIKHYNVLLPRRYQIPLTVPEGGFIRFYCRSCRAASIVDLADQLIEELNPEEIDLEESALARSRRRRDRLYADLGNAFRNFEQSFSHW